METYYAIGKFVTVFGFLIQVVMLVLQASALNRHGSGFFLLLCGSSACGLIYAVLAGLPYFVPLSMDSTLFFVKASLLFGVLGSILAIWGTVLLFRAYRKLSEGGGGRP